MSSDLEQATALSGIETLYFRKNNAIRDSNNAIREAVIGNVVTQTQVAQRIGLSQSAISQIVNRDFAHYPTRWDALNVIIDGGLRKGDFLFHRRKAHRR